MNFRLVYLAALLCLAACNGSGDSTNDGTFSGETKADAHEKAQAEVATFKANGLAEANAEIKILKDETAKTKVELLAGGLSRRTGPMVRRRQMMAHLRAFAM
ncbi:hypothetical protein LJR231_000225 [Phyllobacterium sp. LjRoot231]|uniref:hypothetical protein n=1 Tax=Phyllobacterium sp. LjRoot231 TaxID=3342289 RepID=UPI003ED081C7